MARYKKGDIVWVPFPFTDNKSSKPRPALIISDVPVRSTNDIIVAQITSQYRDDGLNVIIRNSDVSKPLPKESYIRCHKVFVIEKNLIIGEISTLKEAKHKEFLEILNAIIGFN